MSAGFRHHVVQHTVSQKAQPWVAVLPLKNIFFPVRKGRPPSSMFIPNVLNTLKWLQANIEGKFYV